MESGKEFKDTNQNEWQQRHEAGEKEAGEKKEQNQWHDHADTEKYLGLEQSGVTFTSEGHPTLNSDYLEFDNQEHDKWRAMGQNSRNADAFSQDDYILRDNIDLDEDQNDSISSEEFEK